MPTKTEIAATMNKAEAQKAGVIVADSPDQLAEVIRGHSRKLFGFSRKLAPTGLPTHPKLYIYSVSEYGEVVDIGPGFPKFIIHPCSEDDDYSDPCIIDPIYFFEEAKVDVTEHTFHSGAQICDAIMKKGAGMNASQDRGKVGWFVSTTNPPSEAEVSRATEVYVRESKRLLEQANRYAAANQLNEINEEHRRAAKMLGQKVDWDKPLQKMQACPGCGENVKGGIIWHATPLGCGYIFDRDAYDANFAGGSYVRHDSALPANKQ